MNNTKPGGVFPAPDNDTVDGREMIRRKQNIVRNWFKDAWELDFDGLRSIVQRRQSDFDIEALRQEIENVQ